MSKVEEEVLVTEGGYQYIENDGVKLRNSQKGRRLKEDGETFEEYKYRQKAIKSYEKAWKRGSLLWASGQMGTYNEAKIEEYFKSLKEEK